MPCGECLGCKLDWAGDWAARCEKESKCWPVNSFITLTYSDEHLPLGSSTRSTVSVREFQLFMKRLRASRYQLVPGKGRRQRKVYDVIRFFASGEYGEKSGRAHYHAVLFNCDFPDKRLWKSSPSGDLYTSSELEKLWPFGFSSIGSVTFQSAGYVARYVMKKAGSSPDDFKDREPPFVLMSRRPGIGAFWFNRYRSDVYPTGTLVLGDGRTRRPPRYFEEKFRSSDPVGYAHLKRRRFDEALARERAAPGQAGARLFSRAVNLESRVAAMKRPVE